MKNLWKIGKCPTFCLLHKAYISLSTLFYNISLWFELYRHLKLSSFSVKTSQCSDLILRSTSCSSTLELLGSMLLVFMMIFFLFLAVLALIERLFKLYSLRVLQSFLRSLLSFSLILEWRRYRSLNPLLSSLYKNFIYLWNSRSSNTRGLLCRGDSYVITYCELNFELGFRSTFLGLFQVCLKFFTNGKSVLILYFGTGCSLFSSCGKVGFSSGDLSSSDLSDNS